MMELRGPEIIYLHYAYQIRLIVIVNVYIYTYST